MAHFVNVNPPTANTEGAPLPPTGTTGRYLFNDSKTWTTATIADFPCYPAQVFVVRETVILTHQIYRPELIAVDRSYYEPEYTLGSWQSLTRANIPRVKQTGRIKNLTTIITHDNWFVNAFNTRRNPQTYGNLKLDNCNFALEPSVPVQIEVLGVELNFATYEVVRPRGNVFQGTFSVNPATPSAGSPFQLELGRLGIYTRQGASLVAIQYDVKQVNNVPDTNLGYSTPVCTRAI